MKQIAGDTLFIDLSKRISWREPNDDLVRQYLGARGINARYLWELYEPGADAFGPDNPLIFGTGLLTGTVAPSSGRTTITCLSPATGWYLKTNAGGHFGGEMKYAGYGNIVVQGQAEEPTYVWIDDARVKFRDARHLWGKDVRETDRALKEELGDEDIQTVAIGPAGENRVMFASVMFTVYNAAGRGGAGAVMGSKNLKAVAVRGTGAVKPVQPARFHELALAARRSVEADSGFEGLGTYGTSGSLAAVNEVRALASYNFRRSHIADVYRITGQYLSDSGLLKRRVACFSCPIGCHRHCAVGDGPFAGSSTGGPEFETLVALGSGCGTLDARAVIMANEIANVMGMDTISLGSVIQWAMESYEKGLITKEDLDGRELHWGDGEMIVELARRIAFREGFGDVLADGVKRAAERVGGDSYKWAVHGKGLEQSRVDTRSAKAYALAFAVNPRGADHLHTETFADFGMSPEGRALIEKITGDPKYTAAYCSEKRAEIVRWHEDCYAVTDALGYCAFTSTALYGVTPAMMADIYSAAIGIETTEDEIMHLGRRIVTLEKCFNVRQGATRADDHLPWRVMNEINPDRPEPDAINSQAELDVMLDDYYDLHGWDRATSWPTRATLEAVGLVDVGGELERRGKLPG